MRLGVSKWIVAINVLAFAFLGLLSCAAMPERARWRWVLPVLLGYGLLIECVQWWLPWREFSVLDLAADLVGLAHHRVEHGVFRPLGQHEVVAVHLG